MISKRGNSQSGMTLVEVITSLALLSLLVLPISSYFVKSAEVKADSQSVAKATVYAENLLTDIKEQIAKDVSVQREKENKPDVLNPSWTETSGVRAYVRKDKNIDQTDPTITDTSDPEQSFKLPLNIFFNKMTTDERERFESEYETIKYSYEVVVWRLDEETISYIKTPGLGNTFGWNEEALKRGLQLYSHSGYKLDSADLTSVEAQIKLPDDLIKNNFISKDQYFSGKVIREDGKKNYSDILTITQEGLINHTKIEDIVSYTQINDSGRKYYKVTVAGGGRRTILIDATRVNTSMPDGGITMEIQNTPIDDADDGQVVIQVRKKIGMSTGTLDAKLTLVPVGSKPVVIERPKDIEVEDAYLIALIVRDLNPANGVIDETTSNGQRVNRGKIVKKMIEIYSYDHPNT